MAKKLKYLVALLCVALFTIFLFPVLLLFAFLAVLGFGLLLLKAKRHQKRSVKKAPPEKGVELEAEIEVLQRERYLEPHRHS
jgi:hypothetical protein